MKTAILVAGSALPFPSITQIVARHQAAKKQRAEIDAYLNLDDVTLHDIGLRRHEVLAIAAEYDRGRLTSLLAPEPVIDPSLRLRQIAEARQSRFG